MPHSRPAPPHRHGEPDKTAVLLVNLGTPEAPTPTALRRYLGEFLADPRVVEWPRWLWWPILHGIILRTRPRKSAAKYATVWTPEGSPLLVHTQRQARLLADLLGERGHRVTVAWAMRYGAPSISSVLDRLQATGVGRILVLPMYPQYSASTTATVIDQVAGWLQGTRNQPEMRFVRHFHDDPGYLAALEAAVRRHWMIHGPLGDNDRLLISFHGLPKASLALGDPYFCECRKTGRLLAERLGLDEGRWRVCFQSRFGRAEWLQPYTAPTLAEFGRQGVGRVDIICPGFVADCLETLEEIAQEGQRDFLAAGGRTCHYIPALNEDDAWIKALADLAGNHLASWETRQPADPQALAASARRVRDLGAQS